jgi:hypothetical protein
MEALATMCCVLAAMFCPMFASAANVLISDALAEGARSTAELIAAIERGSRLPTIAQPDWTTLVQREPQGRFEVGQSAAAPTIAALSPPSGPIGALVTIRGANFTSNNLIQFRGAQASFAAGSPVGSESGTSLQFLVTKCPSYEPQCPGFYVAPGDYRVTVINKNGESNEATFVLISR